MENYTLEDIKAFLQGKGYTWKGEIWQNGLLTHKVKNEAELYGRTRPIVMFVLYKGEQTILQNTSVFDTRFKFWQETILDGKHKFVLENDFSNEWADFLASRHNELKS